MFGMRDLQKKKKKKKKKDKIRYQKINKNK